MQANNRFPVLSILAKIMFMVGIVLVGVGLFFGAKFAMELGKVAGLPTSSWNFEIKDYVKLGSFILNTSIGLIVMAIAEVIGVIFAIESNTRASIARGEQ